MFLAVAALGLSFGKASSLPDYGVDVAEILLPAAGMAGYAAG